MKRALIAAAAAVAIGVVALASAGNAQQPGEQTLTFYEKASATTFKFVDARPFSKLRRGEPERISPGDGFVLTGPLFSDEARKTRVGTFYAQCTLVRAPKGRFNNATSLCHGVFRVDGKGTISVSGAIVGEEAATIAVNGGTGAYEGAEGTLTFKETRQGDIDTFHLLP